MEEKTTREIAFKNEIFWLIIAFAVALTLRLLRLGEVPLSDDEARWALQALELSRGFRPEIGPNPTYVLLTALAFFIFQASDFTARLIPALAGSLLVFAPFLFADRLGRRAVLILAFGFAIEPGLLALSRLAGSPILVLTAALFAFGFWRQGRFRLAGVLAGLALLSGPALWPGVLGVLIAAWLFQLWQRQAIEIKFNREVWQPFGLYLLGSYGLFGSLFLLVPAGLGAGFSALPAYLNGFLQFSDLPLFSPLVAIVVYSPLALVAGAASLVRGWLAEDKNVQFLSFWLLIALFLMMVYPARQIADLIWVLVPLWALAAMEIERYIHPIRDGKWETIGMLALSICMLAFATNNLMTIAIVPMEENLVQIRWLVFFGALVLLLLSSVLVAFGWTIQTAVQGTVWGLLASLTIYTLAAAMGAAQLRTDRTVEMWSSGPQTAQASLLINQMGDLARWKVGVPGGLDVQIVGINSPALRWLLRDWQVTESATLSARTTPAFIITNPQVDSVAVEAAYRGTDIIWRKYPAWGQAIPSDWLRWLMMRDMPQAEEPIILWVRTDIFIDSQNLINP